MHLFLALFLAPSSFARHTLIRLVYWGLAFSATGSIISSSCSSSSAPFRYSSRYSRLHCLATVSLLYPAGVLSSLISSCMLLYLVPFCPQPQGC
ncbi:hypothetical protein EDB92DRAFT_722689 [Lactarius akahatsu]|uniref:Secreted peptide n=1 Tax=Lactarius akahatsu TaxID=416441 RepID=A0AAD4LFU5_9AGAM|nr:hypothetical protein EDB92DRAFT_722689 [Lactarius akahatsu]